MDFDGLFIKSLKNDDLITLKKIPKTDLHNHSSRGANRKYFKKKYNANLGFVPRFHDIESMNYWYDKTFHSFADGSEGFRDRLISLFIEANEENIQYFSPMFCLSMKKHFNNSLIEYFSYIKYISNLYAPNTAQAVLPIPVDNAKSLLYPSIGLVKNSNDSAWNLLRTSILSWRL